jgi:hypothetical protein
MPVGWSYPARCRSDDALEALFEAGALPRAFTEEEQAGATDLRVPVDDDLLDTGRPKKEGAFNADTVAGDTPHGEGCIVLSAGYDQDCSLENLDAFPITLFNFEVDADGVTGEQFRNVLVDRCFN